MSATTKMFGLGLVGTAIGAALTATGVIDPSSFDFIVPDTLKDQISALAADDADALKDAGIQLLDADKVKALGDAASNYHIIEHGDKFITIAKDGLQQLDVDEFGSKLQDAAKAVNSHFLEPSQLTDFIKDFPEITKDNLDKATNALAEVFGKENAEALAKEALDKGGKLAEATLSTIGDTPFEQAVYLSNAVPAGVGAAAGMGTALLLPESKEKPVVGPQTAKIMAERQRALSQSLDTLQQNGFRTV